MNKPTLVVRCPDAGCKYVTVEFVKGHPIATIEVASAQRVGQTSRIYQATTSGSIDLSTITEAGLTIDAACKCGRRYIDLVWVRGLVAGGARGKVLADAPLRPYDGG